MIPSPTAGLGAGITVRRQYLLELADRVSRGDSKLMSRLDWVEIIPENFAGRGGWVRRALLQISKVIPMTLHGVSLSIGSLDPLNKDHLKQLAVLTRDVNARWVTDHLCFSSAQGTEFHNLLPLPFTREAVKHVVKRVKQVQAYFDVPFGLENPSYYAVMPGAEMTEAQFISEIAEQANCRILLDINNVFVNSVNHQPWRNGHARALESARQFLRDIPLDRVIEVHIAGHDETVVGRKPLLLDTHGAPVPDPVRQLLSELGRLMPIESLLLEREANVPPLDDIASELESLWASVKPRSAASARYDPKNRQIEAVR